MNLPAPFYVRDGHLRVELPGAQAVFTTRRGGVSEGPYESLNLGRWTDDDPAAVEHNRTSLARDLDVAFAYGRQVHGARVRCVAQAPAGVPDPPQDPPQSDGQATNARGVAPMVLTADCLPVAVAGGGAVAMLHAGWRGLAGGVIAAGVAAVRELAGADAQLAAAIGPGASLCCYEVSEEVHEAFARRDADVRVDQNLDLKAIARLELERAGVAEVHDVGLCTICSDPSLFFSHRREHGLTGRQAGVAWLS